MNYLLDKKTKKKKFFRIILFVAILVVLFYFSLSIFNGFALLGHTILRPVLVLGNNIGKQLGSFGSYFVSKNSLYLENKNLKLELNQDKATMSNYNSILIENIVLKEILGRSNENKPMILSAILSKPNQSPYDTLVIDVGIKKGLQVGDMVFALGNVPIGRISNVYINSSKVILFSNTGEKTQVVVSDENIFMEVIGRGGGNFEMIILSDFTPIKGDEVVLPGITPYVLGIVETIISDPRDPFVKALLVSPVNIQELKFVEVELQQ
ncbi:rod shape-determining protein MreC [Candidatus Nomurabacteria bacterium]|nr:rod shape-determining protein MreC [Candidatus Nomurabacteria bacterium]